MRRIEFCTAFKRDHKRMLKRGASAAKLDAVLALLMNDEPMPARYRPHRLSKIKGSVPFSSERDREQDGDVVAC